MNARSGWYSPLLATALVAAAAASAAAQQLTPSQEQLFQRRRISIEVGGVLLGSASSTMITASSHLVWAAHEGFAPISDSTFFMRMNMPNEARESGHWVHVRQKDFKTGAILSGVGIVGMLATASTAVGGNWTPFWVSTGVSCVGIGFLYAALAHAGNRYPVSTVEGLLDPYNAQLRSRILKNQVADGGSEGERLLVGLSLPVR